LFFQSPVIIRSPGFFVLQYFSKTGHKKAPPGGATLESFDWQKGCCEKR
jgi:hypothetical protein